MRPAHVYTNLSDDGYDQLVAALHRRWREATRAVMVLLSARGMTAAEIAVLLHYDPATVRRWIARHDTEGITGLVDRPRCGRPRKGSGRLGERIRALLAAPKAWTTPRVWQALGRPTISLRTCYRRIREHARWRRPRLAARGDPDRETICQHIRTRIAALPAGSVALAADESHLDLLARIRACWILRGQRHTIDTPGSNQRRSLFGATDLVTEAFHYAISRRAVSAVFCQFLDQLLTAYPTAPTVAVICDNASIHHSGITRRWLAAHPRLLLLEGARYCPQDNPTERIWAALKHQLANTAPTTMADRLRQVHAFFRHRTPDQNLITAAPWSSPWLPHSYRQNFRQAA
ncbi:transposase [Carbonactinospora thermoautotrophica]|uniref:Transposase n=1 Tax=Carbonactinospora thermoautotrophica TaxID=1469144 RepID=A0A132ND33_9ACTN|nr:IS630 family transposase [Carbonactinospora thermoautotrophica]KWW98047.1 transposase [Carbonactinospora thermoautotrophica]KWX07867.1 transposase [Carbonactinospora thermoautotrophica]